MTVASEFLESVPQQTRQTVLTKTGVVEGVQCVKRLWFRFNAPAPIPGPAAAVPSILERGSSGWLAGNLKMGNHSLSENRTTRGSKMGNHSLSWSRATLGQTLVPKRCFCGEAKFVLAEKEAKRVPTGQTMVPVTTRDAATEGWCAREELNLHPLRDRILSPARLPFRHARMTRFSAAMP